MRHGRAQEAQQGCQSRVHYNEGKGQNFEGAHKPKTTQLRELNGMLVRRWNRVECWDPYPLCGNETEKDLILAELAAQHDVVECASTREDAIAAHSSRALRTWCTHTGSRSRTCLKKS